LTIWSLFGGPHIAREQLEHRPARLLGALSIRLNGHALAGLRMQEAASTRSPSISTMQV
jgi:hypothetical protein